MPRHRLRIAWLALAVIGVFPAASDGAIRIYNLDDGGSDVDVFSKGGLTITARCGGTSSMELRTRNTKDHATIHRNHQESSGGQYQENDDWSAGVQGPSTSNIDAEVGQIVYVAGKSVVTVDYMATHDLGGGFPGGNNCLVAGTARMLTDGANRINRRMESGTERSKV